jgi:Ubiquinone biosynthesis protein COQ7
MLLDSVGSELPGNHPLKGPLSLVWIVAYYFAHQLWRASDSTPSTTNMLWEVAKVAGFGLGAVTALVGNEAAMAYGHW